MSGLALSLLLQVQCMLSVPLQVARKDLAAPNLASGHHDKEPGPPLMHLLFLLKDSLPHADVWARFLRDAPEGSWMAWCHCSDYAACDQGGNGTLGKFKLNLVPWVRSQWGQDLVTPMAALLRAALGAQRAGGARAEKFVLLSDSTLPVKPFAHVYGALTASRESSFCFRKPSGTRHWAQAQVDGVVYVLPRHDQWMVLNRTDSEKIVSSWSPIKLVSNWSPFLPNLQQWNVTLPTGQTVPRNQFLQGSAVADEDAPFALLRGPISLRSHDYEAATSAVYREHGCTTFLELAGWLRWLPEDWATIEDPSDRLALQLVHYHAFIIPDDIYKEPNLHPMVINKVSEQALQAMRASPFLFARKFDSDMVLPDYERILFEG